MAAPRIERPNSRRIESTTKGWPGRPCGATARLSEHHLLNGPATVFVNGVVNLCHDLDGAGQGGDNPLVVLLVIV